MQTLPDKISNHIQQLISDHDLKRPVHFAVKLDCDFNSYSDMDESVQILHPSPLPLHSEMTVWHSPARPLTIQIGNIVLKTTLAHPIIDPFQVSRDFRFNDSVSEHIEYCLKNNQYSLGKGVPPTPTPRENLAFVTYY